MVFTSTITTERLQNSEVSATPARLFETYTTTNARFGRFVSNHTQWIQDVALVYTHPKRTKVPCVGMLTCEMLILFDETGHVLHALKLLTVTGLWYRVRSRARLTTVHIGVSIGPDCILQYKSYVSSTSNNTSSSNRSMPSSSSSSSRSSSSSSGGGGHSIQDAKEGKEPSPMLLPVDSCPSKDIVQLVAALSSALQGKVVPVIEEVDEQNLYKGHGLSLKDYTPSTPLPEPTECVCNVALATHPLSFLPVSSSPTRVHTLLYRTAQGLVIPFDCAPSLTYAVYQVCSGERLRHSHTDAWCTVIGVWNTQLWVHADGEVGARPLKDVTAGLTRSKQTSTKRARDLFPLENGWVVHGCVHVVPIRTIRYRTNMGFLITLGISDRTCSAFGYFHGARVTDREGVQSTVLGVYEQELWFHRDGEWGAIHAHGVGRTKEGFIKILGWSNASAYVPVQDATIWEGEELVSPIVSKRTLLWKL